MANAYAIITEANRRLDMGAITLGEWESEIAEWKDAEPVRHGRWISTGFMEVKCSICGAIQHELEDMDYCPHCGARMDGERREDETD